MRIPFLTGSHTGETSDAIGVRPLDDEVDMFGITHPGLKRKENQDHFLLATIHPEITVHGTSLPSADSLPLRGTRLGTVMLVADGVGGASDGGTAAKLATESIMRYVASSLSCLHLVREAKDAELHVALREAMLQAHDAVRAEAAARDTGATLATTMTLGIGVYPWVYVVQVGDSRMYIYTHGKLNQVTRDQTLAQDLLDQGALSRTDARRSPLNNVLSSALGAKDAVPVVSKVDCSERGCVLVFCSDGLTKHVSDEEISRHCANITSSEQMCRDLLQLALDRGGSDNITIIIVSAPLKSRRKPA